MIKQLCHDEFRVARAKGGLQRKLKGPRAKKRIGWGGVAVDMKATLNILKLFD